MADDIKNSPPFYTTFGHDPLYERRLAGVQKSILLTMRNTISQFRATSDLFNETINLVQITSNVPSRADQQDTEYDW